jgi:F-type H+-transporting ATPase subunit delta
MFAADRWALAFTGIFPSAAEAEEGLALFKALAEPLAGIRGLFSGVSAASRLDRTLRQALGPAFRDPEVEKVCRFLVLLVRRGRYRHVKELAGAIEKRLDEMKGVLPVSLESAFPLGGDYEEKLKDLLKKESGAREIRLEKQLVPELLGGCRLRIGSERLDATVRAYLRQMTKDLAAPGAQLSPGTAAPGGL